MEMVLNTLRTAPPPSHAALRPLLSDVPINTTRVTAPSVERASLPMSPIQYLTAVVDSVAPLVKIRQQKGVLGGGQSMPIPVPLRVKQRRRSAIKWILESSQKRTDPQLAERIAKEVMAVAAGSGGVWEKRAQTHRMAVTARSNVRNTVQGRKR
jgi:small subunit ribosomal protein S7